jgi:hypothetical protein
MTVFLSGIWKVSRNAIMSIKAAVTSSLAGGSSSALHHRSSRSPARSIADLESSGICANTGSSGTAGGYGFWTVLAAATKCSTEDEFAAAEPKALGTCEAERRYRTGVGPDTLASVGRFNGVDIAKFRTELSAYVEQTTPRNTSGPEYISMTNVPACGRAEAIRLTERIRPILDRLYPTWQSDTEPDKHFEFAQERDGAMRLIAQLDSLDEIEEMLAGHDASPALTGSQLYPLVWTAASAQWSTGHRQEAVLAAAKAVNSVLQDRLGRRDISDVKLVREAFSEKGPEPDRPRLRFSDIDDE